MIILEETAINPRHVVSVKYKRNGSSDSYTLLITDVTGTTHKFKYDDKETFTVEKGIVIRQVNETNNIPGIDS